MDSETSSLDGQCFHSNAFRGVTVAFERCPLCSTSRRPFTCQKCVGKGDFNYENGNMNVSERYAEKLQRYAKLKRERDQLCAKLTSVLHSLHQSKEVSVMLRQLSERVGCLREARAEQRHLAEIDKHCLDDRIKKFKDRRSKAKVHSQKKDKILKLLEQSKITLSLLRCKLEEKEDNLCEVRQRRVKQLANSLFPVTKVIVSYDSHPFADAPMGSQSLTSTLVEVQEEVSKEEDHVVAALAEARRMSYIKGKWVDTDNGNETQYSIVHPNVRLPANGDYTAYTKWGIGCEGTLLSLKLFFRENLVKLPGLKVNKHVIRTNGSMPSLKDVMREEDPSGNLHLHNDGHQTLAVLSFTTQLVTSLSFFLGISLPRKLHYSTFLVKQLELREFSLAVERLCINVLYLCCCQGADLDVLVPQNPLGNLLQLIATKSSLFGRCLPFEINPDLFLAVMSPPSSTTSLVSEASSFIPEELSENESSHSEEEEHEWETVPETDIPLIPSDTSVSTVSTVLSGPSVQEDKGEMSSSNMSQVAGNLMSSAASSVASALWRVASRQYDKS